MMMSAAWEAIHPSTKGSTGNAKHAAKNRPARIQFWIRNVFLSVTTAALLVPSSGAADGVVRFAIYTSRRFWMPINPWGRKASRTTIMTKAVDTLK